MAAGTILTRKRHRILREHVPRAESWSVVFLSVALVALVMWVFGQRDAYDPAGRDLPPELLSADGPKMKLYNAPLKQWVEPGTQTTGGGTPALGLFPESVVADAWSVSERVRTFKANNLYEKINGEAEKFIKQGFLSLHYVVLRATDGTEFAIELYDQGDIGRSLGIFAQHVSANRCGTLHRLRSVSIAVRRRERPSRSATGGGMFRLHELPGRLPRERIGVHDGQSGSFASCAGP